MCITRKNKNYKDKERLTCVTWWFSTGVSHLMCIIGFFELNLVFCWGGLMAFS